jgi:hypothetical protein
MYEMKKTFVLALALAASAISSSASASGNEIYGGVGTTGFTAGYARAITPDVSARAEVNILKYDGHLNNDDVRYEAKLKLNSGAVYADYFPFDSSAFRLTGGAFFGDRKVDLKANAMSGTVTINGVKYNVAGESLTGSVKLPSVAPYIGIGSGHKATGAGLSFSTDLGVAIGKPDVTLSASPSLLAMAGQKNVDAERDRLQDKVDKYNLYPVLRFTVGYVF